MPESFDVAVLGEEESSEITQLLRRCPDVEALKYLDGDFLIREGEEEQDLYIVVRGAFTVERPASAAPGPPVILASVMCDPSKVAIVGEMAYFGKHPRSATVRSSGASYVLRLKPEHIDVIMEGFPMLTRVICQQFARRLRKSNDQIRDLQARFALAAQKRLANPGEILFSIGEPARHLFQIAAGEVRLERDGQSVTLEAESLPMGFLEPEAFLRNGVQTATAIVEQPTLLAVVDTTQKEALLRCYPQLALSILER